MSGGQKYHININSGQRVTPVGVGMNNRVMVQHQQYSASGQPRRISMPQSGANATYMHPKSYTTSVEVINTPPGTGKGAKGGKKATAGPSTSAAAVTTPSKGRRKVVKVNKGLRHFSMKVCEKVKEKGTTTYNEVADELVEDEMRRVEASGDRSFDQKNIRRRVYDALNVLMAMNIIAKEKKEIHWLGLPTNTPAQCATLDEDIAAKKSAIQAKEKELRDLLLLQVSLKNLVNRNREAEEQGYIPTPHSHIQLPFIVVNTHRDTRINCTISQDKTEYFFKFDDKFELNDHVTVLQRMGLLMGLDKGTSTEADIKKMKQLVPPEFQSLIEDYGRGKTSVDMHRPGEQEEGLIGEEDEAEEEEEGEAIEEGVEVEEDDAEEMIEYVDVNQLAPSLQPHSASASATVVGQQFVHYPQQHMYQQQSLQQVHHQQYVHEEVEEEYSEEDTIIEEGF